MFRPRSQLLTPENSTPNHHRVNIQPKIAKVKKKFGIASAFSGVVDAANLGRWQGGWHPQRLKRCQRPTKVWMSPRPHHQAQAAEAAHTTGARFAPCAWREIPQPRRSRAPDPRPLAHTSHRSSGGATTESQTDYPSTRMLRRRANCGEE